MKNYKNLIKIGGVVIGLSLAALIYSFFNMYTLAGKCLQDVGVLWCPAYANWAMLHKLGLITLGIGIVILVIGLLKRSRNKP